MKKILLSIVPLAILAGAAAWGGKAILEWKNADKAVPDIPAYTSYSKALGRDLPAEVAAQAKAAGCKGYILPVEDVPAAAPDGLKEDLNLALSAYENWQILVTPEEKERMKNRWDDTVSTWGSLISGRDLERFMRTQSTVALQTNYSVKVDFIVLTEDPVHTRRVILTVNDEKSRTRLFEIPVAYTDAATVAGWEAARDERIAELAVMEKTASTARIVLPAVAGAVVLFYIILLLIFLAGTRKKAGLRKAYLAQIEKREQLVVNGHYTAALELADTFLEYFPDDVEIKAFRERLLVFCGGDTRKAEEAYVHAAKLKAVLDAAGGGKAGRLSEDERKAIASLVPYHQSLKDSYKEYLALEERREADTNAKRTELAENIQTVLKKRDVAGARDLLKELTALAPEDKETRRLREALAPSPANLVLNGNGRRIFLFSKSEILIGRTDEGNNPDVSIENNRVSRKHLQLSLRGDDLHAEDQGSANGSYLNGQALTEAPLADGDTLNLGKVIDFKVLRSRETSGLARKDLAVFIGLGKAEWDEGAVGVVAHRVDDLFLLNADTTTPLHAGDSVNLGGAVYTVEEVS